MKLESYKVKVELITPLHIGDGNRLAKTDYVAGHHEVFILDLDKISNKIGKEDLDEFVKTVEKSFKNSRALENFLSKRKINPKDVSKYSIKNKATESLGEILTAVKTPNFLPYVPGSSLKGAIRTALQYKFLKENPNNLSRVLNHALKRGVKARQAGLEVERIIRGKENSPHYDLLRFFKIADSKPVSSSSLAVFTVKILEKIGRTYSMRGVPITVEAVKPETVFETTITLEKLDEKYLSELGLKSIDIGTIISACNDFSKDICENEIKFFEECGNRELHTFYENLRRQIKDDSLLVRVGWGSGYDATTIGLLLKGDPRFKNIRSKFKLGIAGVAEFPISRKIAIDNGKQMPLGWLKIHVVE